MSYWKRRWKRAWRDSIPAREHLKTRAVVALISVLLLYLGLLFSPALEYLGLGTVQISDVEISRMATAAGLTVLTAFVVCGGTFVIYWFSAPRKMWEEQRRQLDPDVKITVFPPPVLVVEADNPTSALGRIVFYEQKRYIVCNCVHLSSAEEQGVTVDVILVVLEKPDDKTGWSIDPLTASLKIWEDHPNRPSYLPPTRMLTLPAQLSANSKRADTGYVAFQVEPYFRPLPESASEMWFRIGVVNHRRHPLHLSDVFGIQLSVLRKRNNGDEPDIRPTVSPGDWKKKETDTKAQ